MTPHDHDPIEAILASAKPAVLAVIAGIDGPSYRPVGAMMAIFGTSERSGTLSSGCIEADIALHAQTAAEAGKPRVLRYGRGSPFADIELPCGGGLDVLLLPAPDRDVLDAVSRRTKTRTPCTLEIDIDTGAMACVNTGNTGRTGSTLRIRFDPKLQFLVFGKGPEASTFAALVKSAGYPITLLSPDPETLEIGASSDCATRQLTGQTFPSDLSVDDRTAIALFFHDHEWEPPILAKALKTNAFYIGAQGSQRARDARMAVLSAMGVAEADLVRLHGPVGLVRSARDPGTLAVSVLAEVLAKAMAHAP